MARMSPGVLVDHGADWLPFVVPVNEAEAQGPAKPIEIGKRSLLARLIALFGKGARRV
ncbi:hypothetical protein PBS_43430 [Paraburkholderia sp. 2C]